MSGVEAEPKSESGGIYVLEYNLMKTHVLHYIYYTLYFSDMISYISLTFLPYLFLIVYLRCSLYFPDIFLIFASYFPCFLFFLRGSSSSISNPQQLRAWGGRPSEGAAGGRRSRQPPTSRSEARELEDEIEIKIEIRNHSEKRIKSY